MKTYDYDAKSPDEGDANPFRYCGEYWDLETNTYYLRARYYNPTTDRFLTKDTHWNPDNSIYGDKPVKWNEREADPNDPLGLNIYTYKPDIMAIIQSGNLYVYCIGDPLKYVDSSGEFLALLAVPFIVKAVLVTVGAVSAGAITYAVVDHAKYEKNNLTKYKSTGGSTPANPPPDPNKDPNRKFNVTKNESQQWKNLIALKILI